MSHPKTPLVRRAVAAAAGLGTLAAAVGVGATLAWSGPPATDPERLARIETLYAGFQAGFREVPEVRPETLLPRLNADNPPVLVDVREPAEQAVSMLPGAVPASTIEANPDAYKGRPLVAYCTIGARSGTWAATMRAKGLDVSNLAGSLLLWTHAGGPLVTPEGTPTTTVHTYSASWDLTAASYTGVH